MNAPLSPTAPRHEVHSLRQYWRWFLAMGIGMVILGTIAIGWGCMITLTVTATWLFGFLLLATGITEIINIFFSGRWSGMLLHLLIGILYTLVGFMVLDQPEEAAVSLTLMIAIFLMVGGVFRMAFAISERFTGWGWVLLNGAIAFLSGMVIYKQLPSSGLWVIGLFIGLDLIFNGWTWIMLAIAARQASEPELAQ